MHEHCLWRSNMIWPLSSQFYSDATFYVLPCLLSDTNFQSFHRLTSLFPHKFPESFLLNELETDGDRDFPFQEQKTSELYQKIITEGIEVNILSYLFLFCFLSTCHITRNLTIIYQIIPTATLQRQLDVLYHNYNDITKMITVQLNSKKCQEEPVQQNFLHSVLWTLNAI